eukprot:COSAG02_NODE_10454_length_1937_cov_20.744831_3_plen_70_part_00
MPMMLDNCSKPFVVSHTLHRLRFERIFDLYLGAHKRSPLELVMYFYRREPGRVPAAAATAALNACLLKT